LRGVASPYGSQPPRLHGIPDWCYAILILPPFLASPISVPITEAGSWFDFLSLVGHSWSLGRAGSFVSVGACVDFERSAKAFGNMLAREFCAIGGL
jgi:hypothetical protein